MRIVSKHIFLLVALLGLCSFSSIAQNVSATAGIDSTSILIGNQTHVHIRVTYDAKNASTKIQWPIIADSLASKVHVVSKSRIDTVIPNHNNPTQKSLTQDLVITSFDSGYYAIPPFQFVVNGDTVHPIMTDALMMQVRTMPVDTAKGFRDIKGPIQVKFPFIIILMYIGIGFAVLLVIVLIIFLIIKNRKKGAPAIFEVKAPVVDPDVKALKALEELALKKLWQEGKVKEYYSGISDILRIYLDDRYGFGALEMTTDEIMYALRRVNLEDILKMKLNQILVLSDLVKFAKEQPLPTENEAILNSAVDFIKQSFVKVEPVAESVTPVQPNNNPVA